MVSFALDFYISFQKKKLLLTLNKGEKVFGFWIGMPRQKSEIMSHLKRLTMVSMDIKVLSGDSFLDKLAENFTWTDSEKGDKIFAIVPPPPLLNGCFLFLFHRRTIQGSQFHLSFSNEGSQHVHSVFWSSLWKDNQFSLLDRKVLADIHRSGGSAWQKQKKYNNHIYRQEKQPQLFRTIAAASLVYAYLQKTRNPFTITFIYQNAE